MRSGARTWPELHESEGCVMNGSVTRRERRRAKGERTGILAPRQSHTEESQRDGEERIAGPVHLNRPMRECEQDDRSTTGLTQASLSPTVPT